MTMVVLFKWYLVASFLISLVFHIATNSERRPRSNGEMAVMALEASLYALGVAVLL